MQDGDFAQVMNLNVGKSESFCLEYR